MLSKSRSITGISWSRREGVLYNMEQFTPRVTRKTRLHDRFLQFHKEHPLSAEYKTVTTIVAGPVDVCSGVVYVLITYS